MAVEALAESLLPTGHGTSAARKLGEKAVVQQAMLLCRDGALRVCLSSLQAVWERRTDEVQYQLRQKLFAGATYKAIDQYRPDFKVHRASRRDMNAAAKRKLA